MRRAPALSIALPNSNSVYGVKLSVSQFKRPMTPNSFAYGIAAKTDSICYYVYYQSCNGSFYYISINIEAVFDITA